MKTIIVTGSNSGIGKEAALQLAESGNQILMICRDSDKSKQVQTEIKSSSENEQVHLITADLADPSSTRAAVNQINNQFTEIDVLINNAGVYKVKREETANGIEMSFAVNFLATFMLSEMLLENLENSRNGRIINVVSEHYKGGSINFNNLMLKNGYKAGNAYANSKLATVLYTADLAKRTKNKGITVNAIHPGVLATNSFRDYPNFVMKALNLFLENPEKGGERLAYLAISDEVKDSSSKYFYKTEEREIDPSIIRNNDTQELLGIARVLSGLTS